MTAEIRQLQSIDSADFRVITVGNDVYLTLPESDTSPSGSLSCGDKFDLSNIVDWVKAWNIDELLDVNLHGESFTSRKFTAKEAEHFEAIRAKLLRCKRYAQNYYENKLLEEI